MKKLAALLLFASSIGAFFAASPALGQPMMMDPSKMSGLSRPDPQVPPQTITVRLIRGQLSNRMPNVDVSLTGPDGKAQLGKTDVEGRATFGGLEGNGPFIASATDGTTELKSQPIELEAQMGSRVMLVFPNTGAGAPDGVGHLDKALPAGSIVVRAEDATGQAAEGLEVVIGHARAGEQKVEELHGKTDVAGEARFDGLPRKPTDGYVAEIVANGARFAGKPFKLDESAGSRVVITVRQVSTDSNELTIGEGSHMLVEVSDDALQIMENLNLHNASTKAFDAGPGGLHIPLPRDEVQAQTTDGNPAITIAGHDVILHGPVPPGDTQVRIGFVLPYHGDHAVLEQPTPVPFARVLMVTQDLPNLDVTGHNFHREPRDMQGKKLLVFFGEPTQRGGSVHVEISGLPHGDATPRFAAAGICILLVLVFSIYAASGGGDRRSRLETDRRDVFAALEQVDAKLAEGSDAMLEAERAKLVTKLADIYRGLDELGGG